MDYSKLAIAHAHGNSGADGLEAEGAGARQRAADDHVAVAAEGEGIARHGDVAVDGDRAQRTQVERIHPAALADIKVARHGGGADIDIAPAIGEIGQFSIRQMVSTGLQIADADAGAIAGGLQEQAAAAGARQRAADNGVGIAGDIKASVAAHRDRIVDADDARARAQMKRILPAGGTHIDIAGRRQLAQHDSAPAILDKGKLGAGQLDVAQLAIAHAHAGATAGIGGDGQGARAAEHPEDAGADVGINGQVVSRHRDRIIDMEDARARAQGERIVPAGGADMHVARAIGTAEHKAAPALEDVGELGIREIHGAPLAGA